MLTPEYLERISESTEEAVSEVNNYLIDKIAARIEALFKAEGDVKLIPSSVHDVMKLQNAGMLQQEIIEELGKRLPGIEKEIEKAFLDAADKISIENTKFTQEVINIEHEAGNLLDITDEQLTEWEKVGLPNSSKKLNMTPKEVRMLENAYKRTKNTVRNMTRTVPGKGQQAYIEACDSAFFKIQSGVNPNQAISEAIDELARAGIKTVSYARRNDRIEVAVARAVRTGINQAAGDIVLTRCAEMGVGYVLVSQHVGARVTAANDYTNHAWWQGKVYKLDWKKEELAKYIPTDEEIEENKKAFSFFQKVKNFLHKVFKGEYPDFVESCGYGTIEGICGINCRHSFTQFYPGVNKNTQKPIDTKENKERYEKEQKQRAMERKIRETKRRLNTQLSGDITPEKKEKARELQRLLDKQASEYHVFCKDNKLPKQNWRLKTAQIKGVANETESINGTKRITKKNQVYTDGKRNENPLTQEEKMHAEMAARKQGYDGQILFSDFQSTSFHGSIEGEKFHYLVIGTDAYPASQNGGTANEKISLDACMAHEIVGHYEVWLKGTSKENVILEEVQASIRASKFGIGLTDEERELLMLDAKDRLNNNNIIFEDIKDELDIWER